ncbi:hypothetical protein HNY73_016155 [Argiope bruennichi]|uniref:Uncharacterized protein n=1 Tax=Argiope bruennichi TaxID=94029 RepID=A0A8T0ELB9_ARGBR|nr:hypothetical protein HNY73_016155 [Argiope bruennichi]
MRTVAMNYYPPMEIGEPRKLGAMATRRGVFPMGNNVEKLYKSESLIHNRLDALVLVRKRSTKVDHSNNVNVIRGCKYKSYENFVHDYVSTINCYKDNYFWNTYICWNLSNRTRQEFIEYMDLKGKDIPNEVKCLIIDYQDACLAFWFEYKCQKTAQIIFLVTQRVLKDISSLDCSKVDEKLTKNFFRFLHKMMRMEFENTFRMV